MSRNLGVLPVRAWAKRGFEAIAVLGAALLVVKFGRGLVTRPIGFDFVAALLGGLLLLNLAVGVFLIAIGGGSHLLEALAPSRAPRNTEAEPAPLPRTQHYLN